MITISQRNKILPQANSQQPRTATTTQHLHTIYFPINQHHFNTLSSL